MSTQFVQAVLFARYNATNFKALYGRIPASTTYTKDYIQIPSSISENLKNLLKSQADEVPVEYVWPNGTQNGHFTWSTDRYHLKWDTDSPPRPWRLGAIGVDPATSLPGNTALRSDASADAQFDAIVQNGSKPWLVAIKLAGEPNRLHLRIYFENPLPNFQDRALAQLPVELCDAIAALPANLGTGFVDWSSRITLPSVSIRAKKQVAEIQAALARDPNVLLVGPPGTGKSVALEDLRQLYSSKVQSGVPMFDPASWSGDWKTAPGHEDRSVSLVFHPSYTYENFVAGLFPKSSQGGGIELEANAGPLLCLSHWVGETNRRALLILDEFNRGPAAAIFGDTLSLLDKDKRSGPGQVGAHIQRPYPAQTMPVPQSYRSVADQDEQISYEVRLPAAVHIVAAMNSTDRSVAPLDAAMRRRFTIIRIRPDYEALTERLLGSASLIDDQLPSSADPGQWTTDNVSILAVRVLQGVNERIEYCLGQDFLLGHALVWNITSDHPLERLSQLAAAVDTKIIPTLSMTFIDQDEVLAAVLNITESTKINAGQSAPENTVAYWKFAPPALATIAPKRLTVRLLQNMSAQQQLAALRSIAS